MLLEEGGLRLGFERRGDRYAHWIEVAQWPHWRRLLESAEEPASTAGLIEEVAAANGDWPPSPPLQELHVEQRGPGGQVALGVGQAGRAHWSVSAQLLPRGDVAAAPSRLVFDIACRAAEVPAFLGSRYNLAPGVVAEPRGPLTCSLAWADGRLLLVAEQAPQAGEPCGPLKRPGSGDYDPSRLSASSSSHSSSPIGGECLQLHISSDQRHLAIEPLMPAGPWPQTVCWRYAVERQE